MKKSASNEFTPFAKSKQSIPSYTNPNNGIISKNGIKQLQNCDLVLFTFQQWNMYLSRTIVYPYAKVYAAFYQMLPTTFAYIISAFDMGGVVAVLITILPSFNRVPIHLCLFTVLILTSFVNLCMGIFSSFAAIFALRMLTGLFATIASAQIRGTLGVTLKDVSRPTQSRLTFGVMLIESAWSTATFGWLFIGIVLNHLGVDFAWYIISFTTLVAAIFCYFLPTFSIFQVMLSQPATRQIMTPSTSPESISDTKNEDSDDNTSFVGLHQRHWIFEFIHAYQLQVLYLGMFLNGVPFYCFFSTFGYFVQTTFNVNPEQLGFITLVITAGEITALVSSSYIAKYKSNMFIVLLGSTLGLTVFIIFLFFIKFNALTIINTMVILYFFTLTIEWAYLNSIVCTLHFSPPGHEATASLIGQFVSRSSSILSVILGAHIINWSGGYGGGGFAVLIEFLIMCQFVSIIVFWWLNKLYWKNQQKMSLARSLKAEPMVVNCSS